MDREIKDIQEQIYKRFGVKNSLVKRTNTIALFHTLEGKTIIDISCSKKEMTLIFSENEKFSLSLVGVGFLFNQYIAFTTTDDIYPIPIIKNINYVIGKTLKRIIDTRKVFYFEFTDDSGILIFISGEGLGYFISRTDLSEINKETKS